MSSSEQQRRVSSEQHHPQSQCPPLNGHDLPGLHAASSVAGGSDSAPVAGRSRKSGRMETVTVTMVTNENGALGETEGTTRERKISSRVRKISDALTNIVTLNQQNHHGPTVVGTLTSQVPSEVSSGSGLARSVHYDTDARDRKISRERKVSRVRKISDALAITVPSHHHHYHHHHHPVHHAVGETEITNGGDAGTEGTARERKVSRVRRISDALAITVPSHHHLYHQHHHPGHHTVGESEINNGGDTGTEGTARERKISKVRRISDAFGITVPPPIPLNLHHHHGPIVSASGLACQNSTSLAELLKSEEYPDRKSSGSIDFSGTGLDTSNFKNGTDPLGRGENGELPAGLTLSGVGDINGGDGKKWPQVIASIAANMGAFAFGAVLAWSATGIPSMEESEDLGELSSSVSSWIGSIPTLGAVAACPFAGFALDTLGRKRSMLFLTVPFIIGWLFIGLAQNFFMVLFGRFVTGFCGGCFSIAAPIFTSETADANIRGGLGSLFDLLLSTGMLYIYVVGVFLSWRYQAIACAIIPVAFHLIMFFVPESPRYLIQRQKEHKAEKAIYWLKGNAIHPEFVQKEMSDLKTSVGETQGVKMSFGDAVDRTLVMPTAILIGIMFFTTLSGIDAIIAYTVSIFESAGSTMDPKLSTIIIGIVTMAASFPTAAVVDIAGRRVLLMASELVMSIALGVMGLYFYMMRTNTVLFGAIEYENITWVPLASLVLFIIGYSLGCGPLSMMMIGELLPNRLKGLTSCIVLMMRWFLAFGVTNIFGILKDVINDDGTYWLFACICFVGIFFVFFFVPETKGKSLAEIQLYFVGHKQNNIVIATSGRGAKDTNNEINLQGYDNKIDVEM